MKKYSGILLLQFLFILNLNAQIDHALIKHLSTNRLSKEHLTYLESLNSSEDSINYLKAKYYFQYEKDSLFIESFLKGKELFINDTNALNRVCLHYLGSTSTNRDKWFETLVSNEELVKSNNFVRMYQIGLNPNKYDTTQIPQSLQEDFRKYKKAYSKKPLLAASLSALIPGLGELYIGNYKAFGAKFASHSIFGLQLYESVKKIGPLKPLSIINGGFLAAFYTANIVGAYRDTKHKKRDTKNQFLINASEYYSSTGPFSLY